ncbi:MAG: exo-alpha-sialidase [Prevotella sp.]|nr:exo-alpha-sialidase [Prevotella sp.]
MFRIYLSSTLLTLLCLCCRAQETYPVFTANDTTDHYANGVVMAAFKDTLYCMWQSSPKDEDTTDTWVAYSRSSDGGQTWSRPEALAEPNDTAYCTSGGWLVCGDTLTAFIDIWTKQLTPRGGYTYYMLSTDGHTWTKPQPVLMADGTPMTGVLEQDPYRLPGGRLIGACHLQPGLHICPVYTDDPSGLTGWRRAAFSCEDRGDQSRCLEPSQYMAADGTLVMVFRDQQSSFRKMFSYSHDRGETWTSPVVSNMLDGRTKQCAGNLPKRLQTGEHGSGVGTAFMVSCPSGQKQRWPLVLQLSRDGYTFDRRILLRSEADLPPRRYEGKAKTLGYSYPKAIVHEGWLYVGYSVNKEDVECTRIHITKTILQ